MVAQRALGALQRKLETYFCEWGGENHDVWFGNMKAYQVQGGIQCNRMVRMKVLALRQPSLLCNLGMEAGEFTITMCSSGCCCFDTEGMSRD